MSEGAAEGALRAHVGRFNEGVRSGDFTEMIGHLHAEAELTFAGVPAGPFVGREAIAAAYRENPPDDEIVLLLVNAGDDEAAADYAWRRDPERLAGRLAVRVEHGLLTRIDITVIEGEVGDA